MVSNLNSTIIISSEEEDEIPQPLNSSLACLIDDYFNDLASVNTNFTGIDTQGQENEALMNEQEQNDPEQNEPEQNDPVADEQAINITHAGNTPPYVMDIQNAVPASGSSPMYCPDRAYGNPDAPATPNNASVEYEFLNHNQGWDYEFPQNPVYEDISEPDSPHAPRTSSRNDGASNHPVPTAPLSPVLPVPDLQLPVPVPESIIPPHMLRRTAAQQVEIYKQQFLNITTNMRLILDSAQYHQTPAVNIASRRYFMMQNVGFAMSMMMANLRNALTITGHANNPTLWECVLEMGSIAQRCFEIFQGNYDDAAMPPIEFFP